MKKLLAVLCTAITLNAAGQNITINVAANQSILPGFPPTYVSVTLQTPNMTTTVTRDITNNRFYVLQQTPQEIDRALYGARIGLPTIQELWGTLLDPNTVNPLFQRLIRLANMYHRAYTRELQGAAQFQKQFTDTPLTRARLRAKIRAREGRKEERMRMRTMPDILGREQAIIHRKEK